MLLQPHTYIAMSAVWGAINGVRYDARDPIEATGAKQNDIAGRAVAGAPVPEIIACSSPGPEDLRIIAVAIPQPKVSCLCLQFACPETKVRKKWYLNTEVMGPLSASVDLLSEVFVFGTI